MKQIKRFYIRLAARAAFFWLVASPLLSRAQQIQNPLGDTSFCLLIKDLVNYSIYLGAPVAVVFVVLAGLKFATAQGNEDKLKKARENFLYTVIGIAVFFGAWLITDIIVNTIHQFPNTFNITSC